MPRKGKGGDLLPALVHSRTVSPGTAGRGKLLERKPQANGHDARSGQAESAQALSTGTALRQALRFTEGAARHVRVDAVERRMIRQVLRLQTQLEIHCFRDFKQLA